MKCTFFLLTLVLTVAAFASSPPASASGAGAINSRTAKYRGFFPGNPYVHAGALAKRNGSTTNLNLTTASDAALAAVSGRPAIPGQAIDLRMGGDKQSVGSMRGQRLWDAIYDCLKVVGSPTDPNAKDPNFCKSGDKGCAKDCTIPNVVNDANDNGKVHDPKYTNDGKLTVKAYWSEYADGGVKDLTFRLATDMYKLMTETEDNCYYVNFPHSREYRICQIYSNVLVAYPTNGGVNGGVIGGKSQGLLNVEIKFSKKTYPSNSNCDNVRQSVDKSFRSDYQSAIAKVLGWNAADFTPYVSCPQMNCFSTKNYKQGQPFEDDPGCNSLVASPISQPNRVLDPPIINFL